LNKSWYSQKDYLQKTTGTTGPTGPTVEKWRFAEMDYSSAINDFEFEPPESDSPHAVIEPSALRAAKA
jgi:hypothetical protein